MPSPIAHIGVGYAIYRSFKDKLPQDQRKTWKIPLLLIVVAGFSILPDLDVIPAFLFRDMEAYHNNFSHSLFFAVPVALFVAGIFRWFYRTNFWLWFVICLISYDLHVIMDALTAERGVMMFWPLAEARFASPVKIFYGLQWGLGWISLWHLWTFLTEALFVFFVIWITNILSRRRDQIRDLRANEIEIVEKYR